MRDEEMNLDQLLADIRGILGDEPTEDLDQKAQDTDLSEALSFDVFQPEEGSAPDAAQGKDDWKLDDWNLIDWTPDQQDALPEEGQQEPDFGDLSEPEDPGSPEPEETLPEKSSRVRGVLRFFARCGILLVETVLLIALGLYCLMYVIAKGPSTTARDLFVLSVRETSAVGFLADLFFTEEEIAEIESKPEVAEYVETDTSLIQISAQPDKSGSSTDTPAQAQEAEADAWGLIDEDGDGIIVETIHGEGYTGYMMVVLDPSRVIMGSVPSSYETRGYTVAQMVAQFDAVAGINAGGFEDPNGRGNGSVPDTLVVYEGQVYYAESGTRSGFVGIDSNYILHVATTITEAQIREQDIQYGVCFGPVLISNGEACQVWDSGLNPRTAIGQRSDGAILMLVIDGRQVLSIGATMQDLIDIMLRYGAVNACNLDGGSSTLMWYEGDYINNCASVVGIRPVPTTFLVLKEG